MPIFNIEHITRYAYNRPVKELFNEIKIFPYQEDKQELIKHELNISTDPQLEIYQDYWGNKCANFNILPPQEELIIESRLSVRTVAPADNSIKSILSKEAAWEALMKKAKSELQLLELCQPDKIERQADIKNILAQLGVDTLSPAEAVEQCSQYIFNNFTYKQGITDVETTVDEVLQHNGGVCQDFAHILLQLLRTIHIPARYVSGYICPNKNGMRGEGATHAWVEAWLPVSGWSGIDPTNNIWTADKHVKLAVGRNFRDCSPVKGTFKGPARQNLSVVVTVSYEDGQSAEGTNNYDSILTQAQQAEIAHFEEAAQQ